MKGRILMAAVIALAGCAVATPARDVADIVVLRVNCGAGADYVDQAGNTWLGDRWLTDDTAWGAVGGLTAERTGTAIIGTEAPNVYLSERYGLRGYEFRVPNGTYGVRLHFAETYEGAATKGARVFSVTVNDEEALKDFDPFDAAAGLARPVVRSIGDVQVTDGKLRIGFRPNVQNPEVNGIEIMARHVSAEEAAEMAEKLHRMSEEAEQARASMPAPKMLDGLQAEPRWVTHMGAVEGSLRYLGREVPPGWLYGATGFAFALNIERQLCPSAPYVWDGEQIRPDLARNVGFSVETVMQIPAALAGNVGSSVETVVNESEQDFAQKQKLAWDLARRSLDAGLPCFAYDIEFGDYFIVHGYDGTGYYYRALGSNESRGPIPWRALGTTGNVGIVLMKSLKLETPSDDATTVRDALRFALDFQKEAASVPEDTNYIPGLRGYDMWIAALRDPESNPHGASFNAQYWAECRRFAVEFLEAAKARVGSERLTPLFDEAISNYREVAANLNRVAGLFPMDGQWEARLKDEQIRAEATRALHAAKAAEAKGLDALARLLNAMP